MKNKYKIIIIIESILLIILLGLVSLGFLFDDNEEHLITRYNNVSIYEIGKPFLLGNSTIKIRYGAYNFQTSLSNDGAALNDSNFKIVDNEDFYEVTIKGSEQSDITYYLKKQ